MTGPTYPPTPAYGEGAGTPRRGNPFQGGRPLAGPGPGPGAPGAPRSGVALALALSVAWNLVALLGVLLLGWPAGNVLLLFWAENAVLGVATLVKVVTAQGTSNARITVNGRPREGSPALFGLFFTFHYGLFCLVHLVFTGFVAFAIGFEPTFLLLGLPVVLLVLRYAVETATTWFGDDGQRRTTSPSTAMAQPYPRIIVLQVAVLGAFALVLSGFRGEAPPAWLGTLTGWLPPAWRTDGVVAVALLLVVKTAVDVVTTRRALRRR
ncbi:DUF6498-containing protein [Microlunatus capsulatus]|uniref:Uncharacterized protein n=1 Tax=Microlunatus capsulatus TaxID=99117 RepID=A0ABS4Z4V4_9ACTN|nr:DUF6498-containing protein [Microlunatus capsulatus]MBP2416078.1 hypothetical protein [Microlunatus capsulatus]